MEVKRMKGLFIFSDQMEDIEGVGTRALLLRSGLDVTTTTKGNNKWIKTAYGQKIEVDTLLNEITLDEYDFLVIPGGPYVKESVDGDTQIKGLALHFASQKKLIAAICAGPRFLGQVGLLDNKKFTAFTGSEKDAPKGDYFPNEKALRDEFIITARGAGSVYEFVYEIIKFLQGEAAAKQLFNSILY